MTETYQLTITDFGAQGDGVGVLEDGTQVFVPGAMPGDAVTVDILEKRRNGWTGRVTSLDTPAHDRIEPKCRHFKKCGGCQLQYIGDTSYKSWVKGRTVAALAHHGFPANLVKDPFISSPATRRRIALKALKTGNKLILGFASKQSHQLVDLEECPVTEPVITSLFPQIKSVLSRIFTTRINATVHLTATATGVDMLVEAPYALTLDDRELLVTFATENDLAALNWKDEGFLDPVIIRREPTMRYSGVSVPLPPASFIQATGCGENALISEVTAALGNSRRVIDLFCGIGTFTFPAAKIAQVLAVEGSKGALDALRKGANYASDIKQIVTRHRDLFRRPLLAEELAGFDAIIFDPPRAGAKDQVEQIARSSVPTVVGVSCNPNTFSRDARILADGGYELISVLPVDQFLWSPHVELVGVFKKEQSDT
ncbi:RNA methyltransferase [Kordiimonas sediminis]|uniref:RNA methyltransferase n=1 Tax=Kordiimonas sediminis TaxID=1735581 RepID=A0A919AWM8_9PROT|nr:23S rRNA (uracil(1939)-C(5))-methyltransferase RlmD [Kordiimonas sediminis]GHF26659.1 RNA methyltransferase [Kordiimonas sediminis]